MGEENITVVMAEKEKLFNELSKETERLIETEEKLQTMQTEKDKIEFDLKEAMDRLDGEAHSSNIFQERFKGAQKEIADANVKNEELTENIGKLETEKTALNKQIDSLNEDIARQ